MVVEVKPTEIFLAIDGVRIHVSEAGKGAPLFLVHGLGGPLMWQRVVEPLSRNFRVLVISLPGFGESDGANRTYTVEEHAEVLREILHQLNIPKAIVAGVSYGGQVSATFTALHPECVERLILICSTGLKKAPVIVSNIFLRTVFSFIAKHISLKNEKSLCKKGERSFYDVTLRPPDLCHRFFEQLSKPSHRDAWLNGVVNSFSGGEEFERLLGTISEPTLILWGENDNTMPVELAYLFKQLIHSSKLQIFSKCGHSVPLEKGAEVCGMVETYAIKDA